MPKETEEQMMASKSCRECEHWLEMKQQLRISELVATAITNMEDRLKSKDFKPTVGDYLKLLQLEKEMEEGAPTEITVRWIEPASTPSAGK